jgi:hypothetical protein
MLHVWSVGKADSSKGECYPVEVRSAEPRGGQALWTIRTSFRPTANASRLLSSVTDAKGQTKNFTYDKDNWLVSVSYANAQVAIPSPISMQDGIGQTQYVYIPASQNGAAASPRSMDRLPHGPITLGAQGSFNPFWPATTRATN